MNPSGLCAAHAAANRNRVGILGLIAQFNGGKTRHFVYNYASEYWINIECF